MSADNNTQMRDEAIRWKLGWFAAVLGMLAFSLSLLNDWVYDDHFFVKGNAWLRDWSNLWFLVSDRRANAMGMEVLLPFWRPLRNVSYLIDYSIAGLSPAWFHFSNLLWHGAATLGLYGVLRKVSFPAESAFIAAALWSVHPVQVESVAWIKERDGLMMGAFLFWSLYHGLERGVWRAFVSLFLLACSLLSKENGVIFGPLYLMALFIDPGKKPVKSQWAVFVGGVLLSIGFLALRHHVLGFSAQDATGVGGTKAITLWTMPEIFLRYVLIIFYPPAMEIHYEWISPNTGADPFSILGTLAILACVASLPILFRRNRRIAFGMGWFLVALLPFSQILPMTQWMAVRFMYIPIAGIAMIFAECCDSLLSEKKIQWRDLPANRVVPGIAIALSVYISAMYTLHWRNDLTLWGRAYDMRPDDPMAIAFYAQHLNRFEAYEESIEVLSHYDFNQENKDEEFAWKAHVDALIGLGRNEEALQISREAVRQFPDKARLLLQLGVLEISSGNRDAAIEAWEQALVIQPDNRNVIDNLVRVYQATGNEARRTKLLKQLEKIPDPSAAE